MIANIPMAAPLVKPKSCIASEMSLTTSGTARSVTADCMVTGSPTRFSPCLTSTTLPTTGLSLVRRNLCITSTAVLPPKGTSAAVSGTIWPRPFLGSPVNILAANVKA